MNSTKIIFPLAAILLISVIVSSPSMLEAAPYRSYTYNFWGEPVSSPQAYLPSKTLYGDNLGVGGLRRPQDLFVRKSDHKLFILDTGSNRIIILDRNLELERTIDSFSNNGKEDGFNNPFGIFVTDEDRIYVADRDNARIVELTVDGEFVREIGPPEAGVDGVVPEGFRYRPRKVAVDQAGRIYVLAYGVYDGIMEFDRDGSFRGFMGAPRVSPSPIDYFWSRVATEEQRRRMALFLPVEHSNIDLDERGFIYATVSGGAISEEEKVRRLNPSGDDVLRRMGFLPPIGDPRRGISGDRESGQVDEDLLIEGSLFVDITARDYGIYSVLDARRGRIFTYDANGVLLYVFGTRGGVKGAFREPVAIESRGDSLLVLDRSANRITIFEPTEYAGFIHSAIEYYHTGRYEDSADMWRKVLGRNANFDPAYTGIGRALLRQDDFEAAMLNFRLGQNRAGYSEAFQLYRRDVLSENFGFIMTVLLMGVFVVLLYKRYSSQIGEITETITVEDTPRLKPFMSVVRGLRYSLKLILHPVGGFWDLKHEKKGNLPSAAALLVLVTLTYVIIRQYTGFIFNPRDPNRLNILVEMASVLLPFLLWCIVNWALTTLMEGKGTFRDIFIASAFALTPIIVINIPLTLVSRVITLEEGAFYHFLFSMAVLWAGVLLFFGNMITHDYDGNKAILTTVVILVGIGIFLFIGLLFFSVIEQMTLFFNSIYREILFKFG